ncbi:MAG: redoxin domain-containing protein [Planctomycetes bacterium]|nr:redoxin domain-containing protein [Planctomycetota bacterium]
MSTRGFTIASFAVGLVLAPAAARALDVGDEAPEIAIAHWANGAGTSVADAKKEKKVLVIEFWATWCGPCRQSIPHISKLYDELGAKGLSVVGVSREAKEKVADFVKKGNPKFSYFVGVDDGGKTHAAYMEGVAGIPHAFVIDQKGVVAWQGHPMGGMEGVVRQLLAGKFNSENAKKMAALRERLDNAKEKQDIEGAEKAADLILALDPTDDDAASTKMTILRHMKQDREGYLKAFRDRLKALTNNDDPAASAGAVAEAAGKMLDESDLAWVDLPAAVNAAKSAADADKGKTPAVSAVLARAYYRLGLVDKAIATQKSAVSAAKDEERAEMEVVLKFYEQVKEEARKLGSAQPAVTPGASDEKEKPAAAPPEAPKAGPAKK